MSLSRGRHSESSEIVVEIDIQRYARHISLPQVGLEGQRKLSAARILVIGAGGLGSPVLLYLAAAGIGTVGIVDHDRVDLSNLQRQVLHSTSNIGESKVNSAKSRLLQLNPELKVQVFDLQLNPETVQSVFETNWDVVIDGCDNLPTRYLVDDICFLKNIPWVYGSIYRFEGQISVFNFREGPCYRDLFPEPPPPNSIPSCEQGGDLGVLPGVVGSLQANEAIKIILGIGEVLAGRLLIYDAEAMNFQTLTFSANSDRPTVKDLSMSKSMFDDEQWCMRTPVGDVDEGDASTLDLMFNSVTVKQLLERRASGWNPFILDVRSEGEYAQTKVKSTDFQIDHESVTSAVDSIPKDRDVVVLCRSGMRSQMAAMFLIQAGYASESLFNLEGGIMAWEAVAPDEVIRN